MAADTTATLRRYNPQTGVLENATSVTVGIVRDSDSSTILATGTATTNAATGVYTYDYSALSLSSSYTYTLTWAITTSAGVEYVTEVIRAPDDSRTLRGIRRLLAASNKLGGYDLLTTSSAATSNDAAKTLISTTLIDSDKETDSYDGVYAYIVDGALAGQQRRVASDGFTASTGTLILHRTFATTPASGIVFELHHKLPVLAADGWPGIHDLINKGLRALWMVDRLQFTSSASKKFYPLTAYPWLQRQDQIGPAWTTNSDSNANPLPWEGGVWLRFDAELPMLELGQAFGDSTTTWYLDVIRPAHTWIKTGGGWGESVVGMASDTDECAVNPSLVVETTLAYAYQALAGLGKLTSTERAEWKALANDQASKVAVLKERMLPTLNSLRSGAASRNRWSRQSRDYWT